MGADDDMEHEDEGAEEEGQEEGRDNGGDDEDDQSPSGKEMRGGDDQRGGGNQGPLTVGSIVWAKVRNYPAWPGMLISAMDNPSAPPQPKPQNVLVHFFGTYDVSWVENIKKVFPFEENFASFSLKSKQKNFLAALEEARQYAASGELPARMTGGGGDDDDQPARRQAKKVKRGREMDFLTGGEEVPRRVRVARLLGLLPPATPAAPAQQLV